MKKEQKNQESLLKKKISELTADDLAALEKPLGTPDRPFPMWGTVTVPDGNGRPVLEQRLTMIADDQRPMMIYSDRSYAEVAALAYCDMPVPSMLTNMYDILERARPESQSRAYMMIGDPGFGKSFLGALIGRLGSREPVEVLDCGGKNMRELLFEMVLDFGSADALPDAIDKRAASGRLKDISVGLLKSIPGDFVSVAADGRLSIDWAGLKEPGAHVEKAFEVLSKISKVEGLDAAGGNALGMNSQYGPAIRAFIEGRPIVFDEYNKSREGTDDTLQTYLQFLVGEVKTFTAPNSLKSKDNSSGPDSFTFRREDMKMGHVVILTGNKKEDGITTRSLNKSVYSRLDPAVLQDPTPEDWQHRLCQIMSGVPVSTLYKVFHEQADKDPEAFGEWMLSLRRTKAELTEKAPVPPLQETLLKNWQALLESTEHMGRFYHEWQQLTDVDKASSRNSALGQEIDEEFSKRTSIDFRKVIKHVEEAIPVRPRMTQLGTGHDFSLKGWDTPPVLKKAEVEDVAAHFGTRMTDLLVRKAYETSGAIGKPVLYGMLKTKMIEEGLKDIHLNEGARSETNKSVEDLLNITVFRDKSKNAQAALAQKILCDYLRSVDSNIKTTDNEQIVTTTQMSAALEHINRQSSEGKLDLMIANRDYNTLSAKPFVAASILDSAVAIQEAEKVKTEEMVSYKDLVTSFVIPVVRDNNLKSIWNNNISEALMKGEAEERAKQASQPQAAQQQANDNSAVPLEKDEGLRMAENRSESGIALTSLLVRDKDAAGRDTEILTHIIVNNNREKMMIVGGDISPSLERDLKLAGVSHISRNEPGAKAKIDAAMGELLQGVDETVRSNLKMAFMYRGFVEKERADKVEIQDLLADKTIEPRAMKMVLAPKFGT